MNALIYRNNPAAALFNNWFDRMLRDTNDDVTQDRDLIRMLPKMDIAEEDDKYFVTVDIPGLTKEDVAIKVENGSVKIEGERKEERKGKYHYSERAFGKFMRVFSLPEDVDAENISAKVANGVLELQMQKNKKAQPREIKIS